MQNPTPTLRRELRALLLTRCTAEERAGYLAQIEAEGLDTTVLWHAAGFAACLRRTAAMVRDHGLNVVHGGAIPGERFARALERELVRRVPAAFPGRAVRITREPLGRGWWAVVALVGTREDLP